MQSPPDAPPAAILECATMPRPRDGMTDTRGLLRQPADSIVNEIVDAEAGQMCGEGNSSVFDSC